MTSLPAIASVKEAVVGSVLLVLLPVALLADYTIVVASLTLLLPASEAACWFALTLVVLGAACGVVEHLVNRWLGLLLGALILTVQMTLAYAKQSAVNQVQAMSGQPVPLAHLQVALAVLSQALAVAGAFTLTGLGLRLAMDGLVSLSAQVLRLPLRCVAWIGGVCAACPLAGLLPACMEPVVALLEAWQRRVASILLNRLRKPVPLSPWESAQATHAFSLLRAEQEHERRERLADLQADRTRRAAWRQANNEIDAATRQQYCELARAGGRAAGIAAAPELVRQAIRGVHELDLLSYCRDALLKPFQRYRRGSTAPTTEPIQAAPPSTAADPDPTDFLTPHPNGVAKTS
ncbi:MAG: hypothetical protein IT204_00515 [Fimbriimonadaceae bacterium]|nr:hypothetical protein [Fimbriimonadaceae bacterium]